MYTLLIVDDEPSILEGMKRTLDWNAYGFDRIESAVSYTDALSRAIDCRPDIGLIDVCIGDQYGYKLINCLNELGLKTKYIMMSGYGEFSYACEAIRCGARDYLLKPVSKEQLRVCVEKIIVEDLGGAVDHMRDEIRDMDPVLKVRYDSLPPLINKVLMIVRVEYGQNLSLKILAGRFRMNSTYLGQLFIRETRLKFSEYLMQFRLSVARERIISTDDKISCIAAEVGYQNLNYFYSHFHDYFDRSPSEMRAENRAARALL